MCISLFDDFSGEPTTCRDHSHNHSHDENGQIAPLTDCSLNRRRFITQSVLASAGLLVATPLILTPREAEAAGGVQLFAAPKADDQKKVGREAAQQVLQQYKEVKDARSRHFNDIGAKLVNGLSADDQKKWDYNFHVLDSDEVNAFALPGGPMFMFTGLYKMMENDDALAAVTGHEMTHVRKEHWAKAYAKSQQRQTILGIGLSIFKAGQAAQTLAAVADTAIGKKFSRGEEDEADQGGLTDLISAGYNPSGMLTLFKTLQKVSGNGGSIGGDFLSDHPLTSDRIKKTQERILKLTNAQPNRRWPATTPLNYQALQRS